MRLSAPALRIEFIRWMDERLKILDEEIMFLFCGPGLEPTHIFRVTFVILFWSDLKLHFSSHEIHARFPWARTTVSRTPVPLLSRFTAAHYKLRARVNQQPPMHQLAVLSTGCLAFFHSAPDGVHDSPFLFAADHCTFFFGSWSFFPGPDLTHSYPAQFSTLLTFLPS
jgi:hypothetical protein